MARPFLLIILFTVLTLSFDAHATRMLAELERYDLTSLSYWHFNPGRCGATASLVDSEGYVHRVSIGDYIGKNDGKITKITRQRIEIVELYPDGDGGWKEKSTSIEFKN